ncbi:MAG TPA: hypothetical protein VK658_20660 [Chryseolinea sp.]|nr:hypothetical protein [Chryseolinea sp.]
MKISLRRKWIFAITTIALIVIAETLLRTLWGFGSMVLFYDDPDFEYLAKPNQERMRFGNHISYNEQSMRSNPLLSSDECVVLGFGDSVINGGTLTDQDSLATSIVENQFAGKIRFLNISAGSWGPDNCAAYLRTHGDFQAKMIILVVSSHDAHDNMTFEKTSGVHESYPDHQYPLAIVEVLDKYIIPRIRGMISSVPQGDNLMINKNGVGFNSGFQEFLEYTQKTGIPLLICLHAEKAEVDDHAFNAQGKEILDFCVRNKINVITGFEIGEKPEYYRDEIHLNEKGQKAWVDAFSNAIRTNLQSCLN